MTGAATIWVGATRFAEPDGLPDRQSRPFAIGRTAVVRAHRTPTRCGRLQILMPQSDEHPASTDHDFREIVQA
jgi:hypothetical protein